MVSRLGDAARVSRIWTVRWADLTGWISSAAAEPPETALAALAAACFVATTVPHPCPLVPACMLADTTPAFKHRSACGDDPYMWTLSGSFARGVTLGLQDP